MRAPAIDVLLTEPNAGNPKMPLSEQDYRELRVTVYTERFNEKSVILRIRKQMCVQVSKNMILDKLVNLDSLDYKMGVGEIIRSL